MFVVKKCKSRTAQKIHNTTTVLGINILKIQQNAFTMKKILDNLTALFNLPDIGNALAMCVLGFLHTGIHARIVDHIAAP